MLDRPVGGQDILRGQLKHVLDLVERENVEVRVLPTGIGYHEALIGPFTVLDFAKAQSVAYVELVNGAVYVQDQDQVNGYNRTVDRLREVALSPQESAEVIHSRLPT
ncbi:MAG: hypothetical protein GEV28_07780 [Actinophytocola sp.]|nr:hypothetical protein [Actinophytocola sp.]